MDLVAPYEVRWIPQCWMLCPESRDQIAWPGQTLTHFPAAAILAVFDIKHPTCKALGNPSALLCTVNFEHLTDISMFQRKIVSFSRGSQSSERWTSSLSQEMKQSTLEAGDSTAARDSFHRLLTQACNTTSLSSSMPKPSANQHISPQHHQHRPETSGHRPQITNIFPINNPHQNHVSPPPPHRDRPRPRCIAAI